MSLQRNGVIALRSLLALAVAIVVVPLANLFGGELGDWTGFPPPGEARLAWDLGWVFIAGLLATWVAVRLAPAAPRAHGLVLFLLLLAVGVVAVYQLGGDWPRWFSAGILLGLPLQLWLGLRLGMRGRQVKTRS